MSLNIENPETHALAAELAHRLDTTLTEAVTLALRDKLAATQPEALAAERTARLLKMADVIADRLTPEQMNMDIDAELYDADGLPR
jgi:hypothetical protein